MKSSGLLLCIIVAMVSASNLDAQSLQVGAFGGTSAMSSGSEDPIERWGNGWNAGVAVAVQPMSSFDLGLHVRFHRLQFRGGGEFSPGQIVREEGDPMTITEYALAVRVYFWRFYSVFRIATFAVQYGKETITYVPTGSATPQTWVRKIEEKTIGGADIGLGLQFKVFDRIRIAPELHLSFLGISRQSIGGVSLAVSYDVVGW